MIVLKGKKENDVILKLTEFLLCNYFWEMSVSVFLSVCLFWFMRWKSMDSNIVWFYFIYSAEERNAYRFRKTCEGIKDEY